MGNLLTLVFEALNLLETWRFWIPVGLAAIVICVLYKLIPDLTGFLMVGIPVGVGGVLLGAAWQFQPRKS